VTAPFLLLALTTASTLIGFGVAFALRGSEPARVLCPRCCRIFLSLRECAQHKRKCGHAFTPLTHVKRVEW
jgi:hypothetical protein